jgi:hypothetical protein
LINLVLSTKGPLSTSFMNELTESGNVYIGLVQKLNLRYLYNIFQKKIN